MAFNFEIAQQKFEVVRDRIALIIANEFANQFQQFNEELMSCVIWLERFIPFDVSELPAVNINFQSLELIQRNPGKSVCDGTYTVDVYCKGSSSDADSGDVLASLACEKLIGKARFILENPTYLRLGFDSNPSFISGTQVDRIIVAKPQENDGNFICMAQLSLKVKIEEDNGVVNPLPAETYTTQIVLDTTTKGIRLVINNT
jgi:hypothetical protein